MALKKFQSITEKQLSQKGVQALADRPSMSAQYGVGGLSADQLKRWFDKLARLIADQLNLVTETMASDEGSSYIRIAMDEFGIDSLQALVDSIRNGTLSKQISVTYGIDESESIGLQAALDRILRRISECESGITDLSNDTTGAVARLEAAIRKAQTEMETIKKEAVDRNQANDNAIAEAIEKTETAVEEMNLAVERLDYPIVTSADNGKFLRVVDGVWRPVTVESAEGMSL